MGKRGVNYVRKRKMGAELGFYDVRRCRDGISNLLSMLKGNK